MLIANTDLEAKQLIDLYDAEPGRRRGRAPRRRPDGVPAARPAAARAGLGLPADALRAALRRPDPAAQGARRAAARGRRAARPERPALRSRLVVPVVGGPSGTGLEHPESLAQLATELGLDDVVRFVPPVAQADLARWCAAATLVAVPSYNESFGLVAAEAQATGTPVVAAAVGGLTTVVRDGHSGLLVEGHEARDWAAALRRVIEDDDLRAGCSRRRAGAGPAASRGSAPPTAPSTSTSAPARCCGSSRERVDEAEHAAQVDPRLPDRRASSSSRSRRRRLLLRPARREEAADRRPPRRRASTRSACTRSCAASPTRTTSGSTAGCSSATCRMYAVVVRRRPARRHLPRRPAAAGRGHRRGAGPAARARCSPTPTSRSTRSSSWASPPRSARSGSGASCAGSRPRNLEAFRGWLE